MKDQEAQRKARFLERGTTVLREYLGPRDRHVRSLLGVLSVRKVAPGSWSTIFNEVYSSKDEYYAELQDHLITEAFGSPERSLVLEGVAEDAMRVSNPNGESQLTAFTNHCARRIAAEDPHLLERYHLRPYLTDPVSQEGSDVYLAALALRTVYPHMELSFEEQKIEGAQLLAMIDTAAVLLQQTAE